MQEEVRLNFERHTEGEGPWIFTVVPRPVSLDGVDGFTGACTGCYGSLGYFNAKADWNIGIMRSAHTPPSAGQIQHGVRSVFPPEL